MIIKKLVILITISISSGGSSAKIFNTSDILEVNNNNSFRDIIYSGPTAGNPSYFTYKNETVYNNNISPLTADKGYIVMLSADSSKQVIMI
jgi:hypothetical protein